MTNDEMKLAHEVPGFFSMRNRNRNRRNRTKKCNIQGMHAKPLRRSTLDLPYCEEIALIHLRPTGTSLSSELTL